MKKILPLILSLVLTIGFLVPAATPVRASDVYTVFVGSVIGPTGAPLPGVPINWSKTTGPLPNSGETNTSFLIKNASGNVTVTAPFAYSNLLRFYVFRVWDVAPAGLPLPHPTQPLDQRTVTFATPENMGAVAIYQRISNLGTIYPLADINPVGITHTVWVNIGVAVPGIEVVFKIDGVNSAASGFAYTDPTGKAAFTYTGTNGGMDNIFAYIDSSGNGNWETGEPRSTNTALKSWVENFVTGGGNIKEDKKVVWTLSGTVRVLPEGGAVGEFSLVNHDTKTTYYLDNFITLTFSEEEAQSPPAIHKRVRFRADGTRSDGAIITMFVVIRDNDEPGTDEIAVELVSVDGNVIPAPGPIGSVNVREKPGSTLQVVELSGGNFQIHDTQ